MELSNEAVDLLLDWFSKNKRVLPWRGTRDPYSVWISEIMLQQTRVEAVKDYYLRFLSRFPTAESLARADEDEVLKAWEGLGYYSRARNLHAAAKRIAKEGFPDTYEGIRSLQGVGDYTAGAISSIAFSLPRPAVDGNVLRVLTRYFADDSNIDDNRTKKNFTDLLSRAYPPQAGDFCESLMELGAIVCVPNGAPFCGACPWEKLCMAHRAGEETRYPVRNEKRARKLVNADVCVLMRDRKFAVEKRGEKGLLANLYGFPFFENGTETEAFGRVLAKKKAKHIFTHVEWNMTGYLIEAEEFFPEYEWKSAEEIISSCAIPSAFKAFMTWLNETVL